MTNIIFLTNKIVEDAYCQTFVTLINVAIMLLVIKQLSHNTR
ncbi:hypothetical protein H1P_5340002 [Hyella patelloides LEGE 07179]|uniref:Uncharacterized protein n=1 Tax=Hyella patelloides LEGE 07179 TaxID=945734 RepID=A0A563W052_9CYAN|nr:hypothetical protein H1P_5340002 [Hyella patelloides LEGE 07179]